MPDPILYTQAMCAAASVSIFVILTLGWVFRATNSARINLLSVFGIGLGLATGFYVLQMQWGWPPTNALGRFLLIIIPWSLSTELIASFQRIPRWLAWFMRWSLAVGIGRVLLHGSAYLSGPRSEWTQTQAAVILASCAILLIAEWGLLSWLSRRSPGAVVPLAVSLTLQCTGITIMLAGYVSGGAAAIPLISAIAGAACAAGLIVKRPDSQAAIGIGVVGLFSLLFIGRFFGALSTTSALILMGSPLLCWAMEIPLLRRQKRWGVGTVCLILVAIPLVVILVLAKQYFDEHSAPLLWINTSSQKQMV